MPKEEQPLMSRFDLYLNTFNAYRLEEVKKKNPSGLYDPINYLLDQPSKQIRPLLCLLSYHLYEEQWNRALPQALAVELFHNFTLMHDDIMDEAPMRRGSTAVHIRYGLNAGILSGDALLILTYHYLPRDLEPTAALEALQLFNRIAIQICEGQQYDMDFENEAEVDESMYMRMIRYKTAVLLGASMALGALAAGASALDMDLIFQCGENMGMAFQIQDDYLDVFGQMDSVGKRSGGDILQRKKTLLYIKALELASDSDRKILGEIYHKPTKLVDSDVDRVKGIFRSLRLNELCAEMKQSYFTRGMNQLNQVSTNTTVKSLISELFTQLLDRSS